MGKGDHLFCSQGAYQHHAIDLGDGNVIQYGGAELNSLRVEVVPLQQMAEYGEVFVADRAAAYSADQIVQRAYSRIDEDNYCLFRNNCEHFVNWCRLGKAESRQVDRVLERAISASTKLGSRFAWRGFSRATSKWLAKSLPRKSMPLLIAADLAQLGAEVAATHRGRSPQDAQRIGQAVGLGASTGMGAVVAGPFGAAAGAGLWALGELAGKMVSRQSRQRADLQE